MPLSYHGFAPAAILIMLLCLAGRHFYELWRLRRTEDGRPKTEGSRKSWRTF